MGAYHVQKINDNLVVCLHRLPGFGKLGHAIVHQGDGNNIRVDIYYVGGFFRRNPCTKDLQQTINALAKLVQRFVDRRKIAGRVIAIKFTSALKVEQHDVD